MLSGPYRAERSPQSTASCGEGPAMRSRAKGCVMTRVTVVTVGASN